MVDVFAPRFAFGAAADDVDGALVRASANWARSSDAAMRRMTLILDLSAKGSRRICSWIRERTASGSPLTKLFTNSEGVKT